MLEILTSNIMSLSGSQLALVGGFISQTDIACCKFLRYYIDVGLLLYPPRFLMSPKIFSIGSWLSREVSKKLFLSF